MNDRTDNLAPSDDDLILSRMVAFIDARRRLEGGLLHPSLPLAQFALSLWRSFPQDTEIRSPAYYRQCEDLENALMNRYAPHDTNSPHELAILSDNFGEMIIRGPLIELHGNWWKPRPGWAVAHTKPCCNGGVLAVMLENVNVGFRVFLSWQYADEHPLGMWGPVDAPDECFSPAEHDEALARFQALCLEFPDLSPAELPPPSVA